MTQTTNQNANANQLGTVDSSSTLPASDPNAAENRALLPAQEYAAWLAAGISPELLTFPVKEMGAMLQAIPKAWRFNDYFIRIDGIPVRVDIDVDVTGDSESLQEVCNVKVHGDCPSCFNAPRETQDNEYTRERRGYCGEDEFIVCECGMEWKLEYGVPAEFKGGR